MGITVKNAMKIGGLRECRVVAGEKGLSRIINNVTIMEVSDIIRWLKGNELLLTTLYPIKDDPVAQRALIQKLYKSKTTALAIKPFHIIKTIPEVILEEAEKLGFPVIEIPEKVSYLDILSPVMNVVFDNKVVLQEDLEQASKILREISLSNKGIGKFIDTLSFLTKNIVTVESQLPFMKLPKPDVDIPPLTEEEQRELALIKHPIRLERIYGDKRVPCIVAPVMLDGHIYGNITCWGIKTDNLEIDLAILEQASTFLSLEFLRLKVKYDVEQQYKNDFMRELLFNESMNLQDLMEWGEKYDFVNEGQYICLLLVNDRTDYKEGNLDTSKVNEVDYIVRQRWPKAITGKIRDLVCVILPIDDLKGDKLRGQCERLCSDLDAYVERHFVSCMGVGRAYSGIKGLRKSYYQAEQAIKLRHHVKEFQRILFYDDLGVYRLLGHLVGGRELTEFYEETIGKLVKYDEHHDQKLVETIEAYFQQNENLKEASQALYIHVNTLKYRIQKVSTITGYHLNHSDGKMMLQLGLKIHEMLR
ncbi:purine catabolism regulator [Pullulanibacillus pueri]|uniref:CdaR family transcriptional regulator n=1 Tax=Pullulanibacillus pueri TaxID=1437324 RepID=A0A8J3A016_9BACL|nr:PucR family transcriptional regulator ligand-binding domain-containing protein [Pullulanibacillus pueri]MBM7684085.1 purine catabolism regulator [Pullulanibacillus pueri]GGH88609.1 CdaR family transcriptional regulator [Pullulanibacillus pueri]